MLAPPSLALLLSAGILLAADPAIPIAAGRTNVVRLQPDHGVPLERAVPSRAFTLAVDMDAAQRWSEAAALYLQAVAEWTEALRLRPSRALERAIDKAERERQRSTLLASTRGAPGRFESQRTSINPLEEGRLLRAKVMLVRAAHGLAPPDLVARARAAFDEALPGAGAPRPGADAEIRLQLCATRAAAGDRAGARLERAHVTTAERHDLDNALALAICAAALGEDDEALARLEMYVLRPAPHPLDPYTLRDLYLANDWDHLRGQPRFETLFGPVLSGPPP
ncbi:MAG TPA: hypothetical protein VGK52_19340 [Polyangia bacterium]